MEKLNFGVAQLDFKDICMAHRQEMLHTPVLDGPSVSPTIIVVLL